MNERNYHYRILILDNDAGSCDEIERAVYSLYDPEGAQTETGAVVLESSKLYKVKSTAQYESLPGAAAFNCCFLSTAFPECFEIAERIYRENPFCCQIFYGETSRGINDLLKSRPIGFMKDGSDRIAIKKMLSRAESLSGTKRGALRLISRKSYLVLPLDHIVYLQSEGHKSYIFTDAQTMAVRFTEDDIFLRKSSSAKDIVAYSQNMKLSDIGEMLPKNFIRLHQSFIVNEDYITSIVTAKDESRVILTKNSISAEIPVSEKNKHILRKLREAASARG
jgi:hypothetical protein